LCHACGVCAEKKVQAQKSKQDAGLKPGATFDPQVKSLRSEDLSYILSTAKIEVTLVLSVF